MNYNLWAQEYEQQMSYLKEYIKGLNEQKKHCKAVSKIDELTGRINSLYTMYLECKHTAEKLRERAKEGVCL